MNKKVILVIVLVLLTVTGLAMICGMKEEPQETEDKTIEKQNKVEMAEEPVDERPQEAENKGEVEVQNTQKVAVIEENVVKEPQNHAVNTEDEHQKKNEDANSKVTEKPKQEEKVEVAEPPKHTHSWEAVYSEREIEKTRLIPWTKCYACGADMTGNVHHIDEHLLNGDSNVHYGTEYREEVYYETEEYISGYKCSCGASK